MLIAPLVLSGVAGCTTSSEHAKPTGTRSVGAVPSASSDAGGIQDPLPELTDKNDPEFVADSIHPILHASGAGPSHFDIEVKKPARRVRVYLACAPDSNYAVHIGKGFSGNCSRKFLNFADIPVEPGHREVDLTIPASTRFVVVVIPTPS